MDVKGRLAAMTCLAALLAGPVATAEEKIYRGAEVSAPVKPTVVNVDLRDLPVARDWEPGDPVKEVPRRFYPRPGQVVPSPTSLETPPEPLLDVQEQFGNNDLAPPLGLNFDAQFFTGVNPPDPVGDVGPNHYIQMINGSGGARYVIYNKSGGVLAGPTSLDTLGSGNCADGIGDPIVLWDPIANRWLLSEFSNLGNRLCAYVSQTADPVSGGWFAYQFTAPSFPDYPKYGVWPDAYYVGTNEASGPAVYALNRAQMLTGAPAGMVRFGVPFLPGFGFQALLPADLDGPTAPPAGAPGLFLRHRDDEVHGPVTPGTDTIEIWEFRVNFVTPASSTLTGPISIAVTDFSSELCGLSSFFCFPQPGSTVTLDPLREVFMHRVHYRNFGTHETLGGNFVTDADGEPDSPPDNERGGVRFVELRKTTGGWFLQQEGTYTPDPTPRWLAATAIDRDGNWGMVHNVTSSSVFPGIRYTGRLATDAPGTLQTEGTIVAGSASNGSIRWGDYAALSVDPTDECTFWYTGMYNPTSQWRTRIATFKHASCGIPNLAISDVSLLEGNSGTTNAVFTLSLSAATSQTVTVTFATANGTAIAPADYTTTSGVATFPPNVTTQTVSVPVVGETVMEPNETFTVNLSGATNATLTDAQGLGTIVNDDFATLSVNDVTVTEGTGGTTNATFTISLSTTSSTTVTAGYGTANGSATAPADYAATSGVATFTPGVTIQTVPVPIVTDNAVESNESFMMNLSSPTGGATIADATGVGTILNDDVPTLSINDATVTEGDTGFLNATFTVSLSLPSPFAVSVNYGTAPGTVNPGTAGVDYGTVGGTINFPPGVTSQTVAVPVLGDRIDEANETYFVNLSGPSGATLLDGQGLGTITDNDAPGFSITDVTVRERITPIQAIARFTVTLTPAATATVNWATAGGTATSGVDFLAGGATLSFTAAQPTRTLDVLIQPDALVEGMETFLVNLSASSGPPIVFGTGTGRILDPPAGGDFNSDNRNDLLWRHDVSGENVLWFMNGPTLVTGTFTTPPALSDVRWKMVGTNDFNADGKPDILWRHNTSGENVLWYMNGSVLVSGEFLNPSSLPDTRWGMSGTGDFNLDGKPDILWRHNTSGENVVWFMNGSMLVSGTFLTPQAFADTNWQAVGSGDFNSDGKPDILWRHALSGQNVVWFMDGTALASGVFTTPPDLADTRWRMVALEDYNFDGLVDIVWRHSFSGQNVMWFMNGTVLLSGTFTTPSSLPDVNWKIVGPR